MFFFTLCHVGIELKVFISFVFVKVVISFSRHPLLRRFENDARGSVDHFSTPCRSVTSVISIRENKSGTRATFELRLPCWPFYSYSVSFSYFIQSL